MEADPSLLPLHNADYSSREYWDFRFAREEAFEWFRGYDAFSHLVRPWIRPTDRVLVLGCGNSRMSEAMHDDGFRHITNVDYSRVVIERMAALHKSTRPEMSWVTMDISDMSDFADGSFDVVIEKGTLDSLLVDERDPWCPSEAAVGLMRRILSEVSRVLTPSGVFLSVTFAQPHFRRPFFDHAGYAWRLREPVSTFGDEFHYFVYAIIKSGPFDPACPFEFPRRAVIQTPACFEDSDTDGEFLWAIAGGVE